MTKRLKRGLIVSCQAAYGEPLYNLGIMKYFAKAAVEGGAVGIRCGLADVRAVKEYVGEDVPVIGLEKRCYEGSDVYITPTLKEASALLMSRCDVIATDATFSRRPRESLEEIVNFVRTNSPETELMADISTLEEAVAAEKLGFDYIGCTLRGYTEISKDAQLPDLEFIAQLNAAITKSAVIAEGGIWETKQLEQISLINPYAVVIGTSITRPARITERYVKALKLL